MTVELNTIHQMDCIAGLKQMPDGLVDLAFADPPFNIGYEYDTYQDNKAHSEYLSWTRAWMAEVVRVLKPTGTFWLAIGDEYAAELKLLAQNDLKLTCRSWVIWYYTFGVNCTKNFSRSHTHLFHFVKDAKKFTFNDVEIREPSARQLVYADGRANQDGRLPDNTWILRPQDLREGFQAHEDTCYFPRVAGTFKERAGFHGCQMPERLLGRIIRASSNVGELILDPFAGSGTTLTVAKKLARRWLGFELSKKYARKASNRVNRAAEGQLLEGAPTPVVSVPSTRQSASRIFRRLAVEHAILDAFLTASQGYSIDRVIADPELNAQFVAECRGLGLPAEAKHWNQSLLRLRKAGKLRHLPSRRRTSFSDSELDQYLFASEIAMQSMASELSLSLDDILCDPILAAAFDRKAMSLAPGFTSLHYRWAAFALRKQAKDRRKLSRRVDRHLQAKRFAEFTELSRLPLDSFTGSAGVYLTRTTDNRNLYLGESADLGTRFQRTMDAVDGWRQLAGDHLRIGVIRLAEQCSRESRWGFQSRLIGEYAPELNYHELGPS